MVSACASGSHAIGEAFEMIKRGAADVIFAGGSEAAVTRIGFAGFSSMKAMSTNFNDDPSRASRPFDKNRDGFVMGEGAGVLVLETLENAHSRGARIYAEIIGYAATCDAFHVTTPDTSSAALTECMNLALDQANGATIGELCECAWYFNSVQRPLGNYRIEKCLWRPCQEWING